MQGVLTGCYCKATAIQGSMKGGQQELMHIAEQQEHAGGDAASLSEARRRCGALPGCCAC